MNAMAVADGEQAELRSKAENLAVMYNQSQTQVSDLIDERDQIREELAELRAEVLAEAQREVVIWLNKKAVEYRSVRGPSADTVKTLASKVSRGAIRIFQDQASDSQEVKTTP
jgi:DNA anti-recombination protein RmuC